MDPYKTSATEPPNHGSESLRAVGVFLRVKGPPTGSRARDPTLRPDRAASLWRKQKADPHESQGQAKYTPFYLFLVRGSLSLKRDNNGLRVKVVDGTVVGISLPYTVGKLWNLASMCMSCTPCAVTTRTVSKSTHGWLRCGEIFDDVNAKRGLFHLVTDRSIAARADLYTHHCILTPARLSSPPKREIYPVTPINQCTLLIRANAPQKKGPRRAMVPAHPATAQLHRALYCTYRCSNGQAIDPC